MNKKFLIAGITAVVLIFIILILIVVLSNAKEHKNITVTNTAIIANVTNETNTVENTTNRVKSKKIVGEIDYYELEEGGTIPIPPTFKYVEGELNDGAVIEDETGNQFVWVPVNDYHNYRKEVFARNGDVSMEVLEENTYDAEDYDESYDDSVKNYGGFYIARYEAGMDTRTEQVISKPDVMPWTNMNWSKAKKLAYEMYDLNDFFQSDLVNSYAWDTTCLWLRECDIDIDDSTDFGNYLNGREGLNAPIECGSNTRWETNHICDLGGNIWELSTEYYKTVVDGSYESLHIARGGGYWNRGDEYPISSRILSDYNDGNINVGFRVVLYLK